MRTSRLSHVAAPLLAWSALLLAGSVGRAQPLVETDYRPRIEGASDEGERAIRTFQVPKGVKVTLFAAEPHLANPVAFAVDERNRFYVVETFRLHAGVPDIRGHMDWLDEDVASRSVADRVAMYRRHLGDRLNEYRKDQDRVRRVEDRDGDGKADHSAVVVGGFNNEADGLGAGVLARRGNVYFACIPGLYLATRLDETGRAHQLKTLHTGYGVRVGFIGHDLHGLRFGPDGKLYFSIGDRGLNVTSSVDGRKVANTESGAVLRCNPDGSGLEVFATGLRNPQELAFNELGDLFTVDNNSDGGDQARLVHLVEGGDSGWRIGWQFLERPVSRGPWNAEKMWRPRNPQQPAHLLPPLANFSDGPSGLTSHPGTGLLPESYRGHFVLADFRGSAVNSGVRSFTVRPSGASYEPGQVDQFVWGLEATDCDFGTDGALYISDWVEGWGLTGKGRIYRVADPSRKDDPTVREVRDLLATGFAKQTPDALAKLLGHADQRIRQEAQFALAERGEQAVETLSRVAREDRNLLARLHAIWGLGQVAAKSIDALRAVAGLTEDREAEVRAQAARVLGDHQPNPSVPDNDQLVALMRDPSPRVRFHAAIAVAKTGRKDALPRVIDLLRDNDDRDAYLRHAGVFALARLGTGDSLLAHESDPSAAVRLGVLLALRRQGSADVTRFLADRDPRLVLEAARAIYDLPIEPALPALANLGGTLRGDSYPLWRRVVNALGRVGGETHAATLAGLASRPDVPGSVRSEALQVLGDWARPPGRDRVTGLWRPIPPRDAAPAARALAAAMPAIDRAGPDYVRLSAIRAAGALGVREASPLLQAIALDAARPAEERAEALKSIEKLGDPGLASLVTRVLNDRQPAVRSEALRLLARLNPAAAVGAIGTVLERGTTAERQAAFATIAGLPPGPADEILGRWLDRLQSGEVPPALRLDLIESAARRAAPAVKERLARFEAARPKGDPLAPFREALEGGDAARGRRIFREKAEAQCLRCHKIDGDGGDVGPDLTGIGGRKDRAYILESIVAPNKQIAEGFETLIVATASGDLIAGIVRGDDGKALKLMTSEGKLLTVPKADIEEQKRGTSAMPEDLISHLTRSELRDLVEFLSQAKQGPNSARQ